MAQRRRRRREQRRRKHAKRGGWQTRGSVITGAGLTAGALLGFGAQAQADTFVVDRSDDDGVGGVQGCTAAPNDCDLRGAVNRSNTTATIDDDIRFESTITGTTLSFGGIAIEDAVDIYGNGPNATTISGGNTANIFVLLPASTFESVRFFDLTLTKGHLTGTYDGGAIHNVDAYLTLNNCVLTGNSAHDGGAIYNGDAPMSITNSTISGNTAGDDGGGIYAVAKLGEIRNSTISGNHAGSATDGYGGGIYLNSPPTPGMGGALYDSTVSGNSAGYGGGIYADNPSVYLFNSIVANNTASAPDGQFPPGADVYGPAVSAFSLIENTVGTNLTDTGGTIIGQDPQLGALASNGGPTQTLKPASSSPVVDRGSAFGLTVDQRGAGRPFDAPTFANAPGGDASDIGAVELQSTDVPATPPAAVPTTAVNKKKKCKKKKHRSAESAKKKKCKKKKKK
jgi:predicted outer membrane repeat protein